MTVSELIEYLQEFAEVNPDMEVRLATQPSYPFENSIEGVVTNGEIIEEGDEEVCYILESSQLAYASKELWGSC